MGSMIDRVAKAILAESQNMGGLAFTLPIEKRLAKAAIEAMRVTTGAMRSAGAEVARRHTSYFDNPTAQLTYEAMIDTALKEHE